MSIMSYQSIPAALKENAVIYRDRPAVSYKKDGKYHSLSYHEFYERVLLLARGLRRLGFIKGDRAAIFSENCLGWALADFAVQSVGGVGVPIYATNTGRQASYIINHSEARYVLCSSRQKYEKLLTVKDELGGVEHIISFETFAGDGSLPRHNLEEIVDAGTPLSEADRAATEASIADIRPEDLLTIIYTSGTTGVPKGVLLSQFNVMCNAEAGSRQLGLPVTEMTTLSFLPLSHVLERTGGYYFTLLNGNHLAFAESVKTVMEDAELVKPTCMVSVPRFFEKIHSSINEMADKLPPLKRSFFEKAMEVGRQYVNRRYITDEPVGLLALKYRFYDQLVFKKIRKRFGGRITHFLCGGAPLDKTINEFMWIIGLPVYTGYGLTETSPGVTINSVGNVRFDSVGKPFEGTELKLAPDGELLVKGPQVMQGYYKNEQATREAMEDGWLKTGDIVRIDENGFVYIVDRKKEIIVTAGGKNIAPQPIENEIRLDKYISQAILFGDEKPYLTAIVTPNFAELYDLAEKYSISYEDDELLVKHQKIRDIYCERIEKLNQAYPSYKTIKYFAIVPREFSIEGGELTPTLKLKRKAIYEKYKDIVDDLYQLRSTSDAGQKNNNGEKP